MRIPKYTFVYPYRRRKCKSVIPKYFDADVFNLLRESGDSRLIKGIRLALSGTPLGNPMGNIRTLCRTEFRICESFVICYGIFDKLFLYNG